MHSSPPHIHTTTHSKPLANASRSLHPHGYTTSNYSLVHKPHPAANRHTHTHRQSRGRSRAAPTHTQGPGEREQRRAARALSQGLLLGIGLGSRPIRVRVTRVRANRGLLGLGLIGLGLIGLGLARVRFWHGLRVRVRVMARVSHAHSAHNPSNPS